jgi:hypothetical protein
MTDAEPNGQQTITINLSIAFGFCAEHEPVVDAEGKATWTYRSLPMALWHQDRGQTLARIEKAAERFRPGDEIPFRELPWEMEPIDALSERAKAFFDGLPLYAEFSIHNGFQWRQFSPDGREAFCAEANHYHRMMADVISLHPIQMWADWYLAPFHEMLPMGENARHVALFMKPPEAGSPIQLPRAHEWERVEMPWGPWKVAIFACDESRVEEMQDIPEDSIAQLVETSMLVLPKEGWEFEWKRHWVWKMEVPLVIVPRMLYWVQMNGLGHKGLWAARAIYPVNHWQEAQVTVQEDTERFGYRMTGHLWMKLDQIDAENRRRIEAEMRRLLEDTPIASA